MLSKPSSKLAWPIALVLGCCLTSPTLQAGDEKRKDLGMTETAQRAMNRVKDELARLKGEKGQAQPVKDEALARTFPHYQFVAVLYRRYPVAIAPPMPLKPSSLFAVPTNKDDKPLLLMDTKGLEAFFRDHLGRLREDGQAKDAVRAWLQLATVFVQDGYYTFALMDDSTKVVSDKADKKASGKMVVMAGGNGEVDASLTFNDDGRFVRADERVSVKPGPRPKCQATKLLDGDPIVRAMAEQELLYLGVAAKGYLDEQRATAPPALQAAIDRLWQRILAESE
jgi:hypothetical protein